MIIFVRPTSEMVIDSIIINAETTALRTLCDLIFLNTLWFSKRATKPKVVVTPVEMRHRSRQMP